MYSRPPYIILNKQFLHFEMAFAGYATADKRYIEGTWESFVMVLEVRSTSVI